MLTGEKRDSLSRVTPAAPDLNRWLLSHHTGLWRENFVHSERRQINRSVPSRLSCTLYDMKTYRLSIQGKPQHENVAFMETLKKMKTYSLTARTRSSNRSPLFDIVGCCLITQTAPDKGTRCPFYLMIHKLWLLFRNIGSQ